MKLLSCYINIFINSKKFKTVSYWLFTKDLPWNHIKLRGPMLIFSHVFGPCSPTQCLLRHKISPIACWAIYRFQSISVSNVCRSLRKQHRIRLHINLFLSFVFKELMGILWDMLVTYDKVQSTNVFETTLLQNGVSTDSFLWNYCLR